jgi:hypothetical protein
MARENPTLGYDHIQGALANLGYDLSDTTGFNKPSKSIETAFLCAIDEVSLAARSPNYKVR